MAVPASSSAVDGRRLRGERTRQLIIEANLALLREDPRVPTSAQIAERAGCSVRSVLERFPDLLSHRLAAADHAFALGSAQAMVRDADGESWRRTRELWRLSVEQGRAHSIRIIDRIRPPTRAL